MKKVIYIFLPALIFLITYYGLGIASKSKAAKAIGEPISDIGPSIETDLTPESRQEVDGSIEGEIVFRDKAVDGILSIGSYRMKVTNGKFNLNKIIPGIYPVVFEGNNNTIVPLTPNRLQVFSGSQIVILTGQ